jgi:UDP-glucose 4-epimerase
MSRRVLITGGLGYIGGRVAQALAIAGYAVRLGTRQASASTPDWLHACETVPLNWSSPETLGSACEGMVAIVHLAAMNEIDSARDPVAALRTNGVATLELLEAAIASGVQRFIYMSTAHVYGSPLQGKIDERTLPRAQHPYAITHKVAEDFVLSAHDQGRIEGVVLRLSNGFGAPAHAGVDRWTLVVNDLCRQAASSGRLKLNTAGTQLRDFITLGDVARAVIHVLQLDTPRLSDGLFNLGGDASVSIFSMTQRVAERWRALTGQEIPIDRPEPSGPPPTSLTYSCAKLKETGFELESNAAQEIDATLRLCIDVFSK